MGRFISRLTAALVIVTAVSALAATAAYAVPGHGHAAVSGAGTITPGLSKELPCVRNDNLGDVGDCPQSPQSITFSGTATGSIVVGTTAVELIVLSCNATGYDPDGSLSLGGPMTLSVACSGTSTVPAGINVTVTTNSLSLIRVGVVAIGFGSGVACAIGPTGNCTTQSQTTIKLVGTFIPTQTPPAAITSYGFIGTADLEALG